MESISSKPVSGRDLAVTPVNPAASPAPVKSHEDLAAKELQLSATAFGFAPEPPVDLERVARIRSAVRNGTFPIYPATIADRLLALKLEWNPHDAK